MKLTRLPYPRKLLDITPAERRGEEGKKEEMGRKWNEGHCESSNSSSTYSAGFVFCRNDTLGFIRERTAGKLLDHFNFICFLRFAFFLNFQNRNLTFNNTCFLSRVISIMAVEIYFRKMFLVESFTWCS